MAQKTINLGTGELTGDGETLRSAFSKANDNFTELYSTASGISELVQDTTPQLGGDLDTNGNKITFADSVNAEFGDNGDLKIFHNGGHSIVRETGTGSLFLQSDDSVILSTDSGTKKMVKGVGSGAVELYHNDILKLNTSTSGVTIVDEVHTEGATPHLTLKRTDNANVPSLRFKGSGGTVGATIEFDGTAGTSNELIFKTFPGLTLTERFRVTYTGASVVGNLLMGESNTDTTITTNGTGDLTLSTNSGTDSGTITLRDGVNGDIILETDGTGDVLLKGNRVGIGVVNQPDTTLHLKDTNSVITLQRTADANQPGLSFQQSGGNVRATLRMDGTSGTSNEVFIKTDNQDGQGLVERLRVGHTGVTIAGTLNGHTIPAGAGTLALLSDIGGGGGGISNVVEDTSPELGGDLNVGGNSIVGGNSPINLAPGGTASINLSADETITTGKILYSNVYSQLADLPSASTYHGMFAHVHATGAGYFAHAGNWIQLANYTDLSAYQTTGGLSTNIDLHLNQGSAGNNQVLSWDGADYAWVNQSGGGGGLTNVVDTSNGAIVNGVLELAEGVNEQLSILTGATGVVAHDCSNGYIFRHTTPAADFTANLTNFYCNTNCVTSVSLMIIQGASAYIPTALQIGGAGQTINWQGGSTPAGNPNKTDVFTFTITNLGASYDVIAQLVDFG